MLPKCVYDQGSVSNPVGGVYNAPSDLLAGEEKARKNPIPRVRPSALQVLKRNSWALRLWGNDSRSLGRSTPLPPLSHLYNINAQPNHFIYLTQSFSLRVVCLLIFLCCIFHRCFFALFCSRCRKVQYRTVFLAF